MVVLINDLPLIFRNEWNDRIDYCTGGFTCNRARPIIGMLACKDKYSCQIFDCVEMRIIKKIPWTQAHDSQCSSMKDIKFL